MADPSKLTVKKLKALAMSFGMEAPPVSVRKDELIAAIQSHVDRAGAQAEGEEPVLTDEQWQLAREAGFSPGEEDVPLTPEEAERVAAGEEVEPVPPVVEKMELAVREAGEAVTVSPSTIPTPREWEALKAMADSVARTQFVPASFKGSAEAVLAAILTGRELGIGPMQSLKQISIIDGRPALHAELMLALMRRDGLRILASESTPTRAFITARRSDTGEQMTIEWTIEDARAAGLVKDKSGWQKYPADMLWARCVGRLGRRLGSDILAGFPYAAEEVADFADNPIDGYAPMAPRQPVRADTSPKPPQSWAEIADALKTIDYDDGSQFFDYWIPQMYDVLFKKTKTADLTADEQHLAGQKLATIVLRLWDADGGFPGVCSKRAELQRIFASVLDGVELEGPPYRLGPDEPERPVREVEGTPEPEGDASEEAAFAEGGAIGVVLPESDPEAEAIPFGDIGGGGYE